MGQRCRRYRIQAVAEMTGVPAATLRAWERRYGIPSPARTNSSYRLYSDRDVDLVRRLRDLCEQGIAPAEAAKLLVSSHEMQPSSSASMGEGDVYATYRDRIMQAIMQFDPQSLEAEVRTTMMLGSATSVVENIVVPVMREVGERWHRGEVTIGQEHLATEMLGNLCRDMLRLVQPADAMRSVLMACFSDETHVLPLYVAGFFFAKWGFRTVVLGARTPPQEVKRAVADLNPSIVALSITMETPHFDDLLAEYAVAVEGVPMVVGGLAAKAHSDAIAAQGALLAPDRMSELHGMVMRALNPSDSSRSTRGRQSA
jgi:DNA-binding transcriptional MerR regulator/methylmalonyl-CoA mutase cobalamin-binding subunit